MGRVFYSLDDAEFNRLFTEFRFTAYRLASRQRYDVSYEKDEFQQFLDGRERGDYPGITGWIESRVSPAGKAGKLLHRVHVVEKPLSDYVRFACAWAYTYTARAGEDVRLIPVAAGDRPPDLPHYDYWLFDTHRLVTMHYQDDGTFEAAEIIDDPDRVVEANHWRDLAISMSMPFTEFATQYDGQFRPLAD